MLLNPNVTPPKGSPKSNKHSHEKPNPTLYRAVSAPPQTNFQSSSLNAKSGLTITQVPVILMNYASLVQETLLTRGKSVQKIVKETSLESLVNKAKESAAKTKSNLAVFKRLFMYLYDQKLTFLFAYLSLAILSKTQVMIPQFIGEMIDTVVVHHNPQLLSYRATQVFAICIACSVAEFFSTHLFNLLSQKVRFAFKRQVYSAMLKREIEFYETKQLNEILHYLQEFINKVEGVCTRQFSDIIKNFLTLLYSAWMIASISYKLTIVLILIVPFHVVIPLIYDKIHRRIAKSDLESTLRTEHRLIDVFQNIRIVKAFSTEEYEIAKYKPLLEENIESNRIANIGWAGNMAFSGFYQHLSLAAIVITGMHLVHKGEVSPGTLGSFLLFSMAVSNSFSAVSSGYVRLKESLPQCEKLFGLLDEKSKVPYKGGKIIDNFQGRIEFSNVSFNYPLTPDIKILNNISLSIKPGDSVAFVGMSGGGKSTIISILLRFYDVNDGHVKLDGVDLREIDLKWLHNQIGYVAQDPVLFSGTIEENIAYGLTGYSQDNLMKVIKMANADFVFNTNLFPDGLKSEVGEKGGRLSGGQKQRIAIARALMREPKILIFDEATSNLDANAEYEVQQAIDNLLSMAQITVITIAHRLSTIKKCNVIFVLKTGEVIEKGSHNELIEKGGAYKTLIERQFQSNIQH